MELPEEVGLPKGLLPIEEVEEYGCVRETSFVWLKKIEHQFKKIGKVVRRSVLMLSNTR
jgi:hypothetical protein